MDHKKKMIWAAIVGMAGVALSLGMSSVFRSPQLNVKLWLRLYDVIGLIHLAAWAILGFSSFRFARALLVYVAWSGLVMACRVSGLCGNRHVIWGLLLLGSAWLTCTLFAMAKTNGRMFGKGLWFLAVSKGISLLSFISNIVAMSMLTGPSGYLGGFSRVTMIVSMLGSLGTMAGWVCLLVDATTQKIVDPKDKSSQEGAGTVS